MSTAQAVRRHPRHRAFASLRTHLLRSRRMLLTQVMSRPLPEAEQGIPADVLDLAACERERLIDDLIAQRAYVKLRQIERALNRMLDTSYGICHLCRADIPLSRLRAQPDATLCVTCKNLAEERASLRRTAWRLDKPAEDVDRS
ncbi:MAG: TraR/DksA C4-type zinc finger protein [Nitrospira sp.]|nr:TraR/DksA C4-type zinc finger protein [Nitrospira sp.]MCS6318384.1 TraR/DksA C4-type zinc finger protein [Nitrospira sp.]